MEKLTTLEAFQAMRKFLKIYYNNTASNDLGSLLGDMRLHEDGGTWDPATWGEWIESIDEVLAEQRGLQM